MCANCLVCTIWARMLIGSRAESSASWRQEFRRDVVEADGAKASPFIQIHEAELRAANARRVLQHALEHRLQIAGRSADHAQHFGRRRLLLQRFRQLARSCLHLLEQPHIADRDHGLVGEGLQQGDLLVAERTHFECAKQQSRRCSRLRAAMERSARCDDLGPARQFAGVGKFVAFGREQVMHMHRLAVDNRATGGPVAIDRRRSQIDRNRAVLGAEAQVVAVLQGCKRHRWPRKARRRFRRSH